MTAVQQSDMFKEWLGGLRDTTTRARVLIQIRRLIGGNPGDHKSVGCGVMELRMTFGPGYRVYYRQVGDVLLLLLAGGTKATQQTDIMRAKSWVDRWEEEHGAGFHPF